MERILRISVYQREFPIGILLNARQRGEMNRSIARSIIYDTLSLCYTCPDEKVCSWAAGEAWGKPVREALCFLFENGQTECLRNFEELISTRGAETPQEMVREYRRLFGNSFPPVIVPPSGFSYRDKEGPVFGETAPEVLHFYLENGFALKGAMRDFPDHIAHELEFMGYLAERAAVVEGNEKIKLEERQMNFFSRFLLPWVPIFCKRIAAQTRLTFYRNLSCLTCEFIYFEKNYLGVPEEVDSQ